MILWAHPRVEVQCKPSLIFDVSVKSYISFSTKGKKIESKSQQQIQRSLIDFCCIYIWESNIIQIFIRPFYTCIWKFRNDDILDLRQYKNGFVSVKRMLVFEIAANFPLPYSWGKKGGNFKTKMVFTEASPFLYFLLFWMF